ncbi:MAG: hypothetical protein V3U34_03895, partial [candidate division NC10 bacterium]
GEESDPSHPEGEAEQLDIAEESLKKGHPSPLLVLAPSGGGAPSLVVADMPSLARDAETAVRPATGPTASFFSFGLFSFEATECPADVTRTPVQYSSTGRLVQQGAIR